MKRILLSIAILTAGCYMPAGSQPAAKVETTTQAVVFEQLAVAVESGEFSDSSQRFVKCCGATLKAYSLKPPAGYDEALMPWLKRNFAPSDADNRAMAKALRGMK